MIARVEENAAEKLEIAQGGFGIDVMRGSRFSGNWRDQVNGSKQAHI